MHREGWGRGGAGMHAHRCSPPAAAAPCTSPPIARRSLAATPAPPVPTDHSWVALRGRHPALQRSSPPLSAVPSRPPARARAHRYQLRACCSGAAVGRRQRATVGRAAAARAAGRLPTPSRAAPTRWPRCPSSPSSPLQTMPASYCTSTLIAIVRGRGGGEGKAGALVPPPAGHPSPTTHSTTPHPPPPHPLLAPADTQVEMKRLGIPRDTPCAVQQWEGLIAVRWGGWGGVVDVQPSMCGWCSARPNTS